MFMGISYVMLMFYLTVVYFLFILMSVEYSYMILGLVLYSVVISVVIGSNFNFFFGLLFMLVYVGGLVLFLLYVLTIIGVSEKTSRWMWTTELIIFFMLLDFVPLNFFNFPAFSMFSLYVTNYSYVLLMGVLLGFLLYVILELLFFSFSE
uniref:NADH dehydrogenase subunit 6 n=1 Tax=Styela plicata TaxID=7726 RepID=D0Z5P7_STYPL|nr:NADH dehydrogenase subunit 6 [Styela plicata]CAL24345.1 NADH dehydrogenase subunit 6 [Styela plicata]